MNQGVILKDHTTATGETVTGAACTGCPVHIPSIIDDEAPEGAVPIPISALKAMQHGFGPRAVSVRCQLEDNADAICATGGCRTVQVASPVEDDRRLGVVPVRVLKAVQHSFGPLAVSIRFQLEDGA